MKIDYVYVTGRGEKDEGIDVSGVFFTYPGAVGHLYKVFPAYAGGQIEGDERTGEWIFHHPDNHRDYLMIQRHQVKR